VLLSCPCFLEPLYGYEVPHCDPNDSYITSASGSGFSGPGNAQTGVSAAMRGLCFAYTDGSAQWVPRASLWSAYLGNFQWIYFDNTGPN